MKIKYLFGLALATLLVTSCSENLMDEINEDETLKTADRVGAKFQLTDAEVATAYSVVNGSYAWYVSSYTEQLFGTGNNQLKNVEVRNVAEMAGATTFNNEWNATYSNLMNLKQMIDKCSEGGMDADKKDLLGMAQILYALNWGILTDLHGDIPFSECFSDVSAPKVDKQEDIYKAIFKLLDDAQANLAAGGSHAGGQDLVYGGDTDLWAAFGHAVKARYLLHTYGRDNSVLAEVVAEAQAAIDGGFQGFAIDAFNGVTADNSWSAYHWSRYYIGTTTTVSNLMEARQDPRLAIYNNDACWKLEGYDPTGITAQPGDQNLAKETKYCNFPLWLENGAAPLNIFSEAELYFILAEAQARLGQDATDAFVEGVTASQNYYYAIGGEFVGMSVTDSDIQAYLANIAPLFTANPLQEILIEKYLAQAATEQIETYNDIRRIRYCDGTYPVTLTNPNNTSSVGNRWPLRLPYGDSDVVSNPNVAALFGTGNESGMYIFTENVWWAGGSR